MQDQWGIPNVAQTARTCPLCGKTWTAFYSDLCFCQLDDEGKPKGCDLLNLTAIGSLWGVSTAQASRIRRRLGRRGPRSMHTFRWKDPARPGRPAEATAVNSAWKAWEFYEADHLAPAKKIQRDNLRKISPSSGEREPDSRMAAYGRDLWNARLPEAHDRCIRKPATVVSSGSAR